jgi:lipopolysaccharide export system protein LptA
LTALALAVALAAGGPVAVPASRTPAPASRSAAPATPRGPVRVDADEVRYVYPRHQVIFTGKPKVRLTQDDAVLTCRRLVATNDDAGKIARAVCTGDVRFTRGARVVTCETATFEEAAGRVTCEGSPVLRDGGTTAHGERLVYELASDEVTLERPTIEMPPEQVEAQRKALEERRRREAGK